MRRSKFIVNRHSYSENQNTNDGRTEDQTPTERTSRKFPTRSKGRKRNLANNKRYHPYQRNKKGVNTNNSPNNEKTERQYFTFSCLKKLSEMNGDDCVAKLAEKEAQFDRLLNDALRPDILVLTVQVLANICRANFTEIITNVLSQTCYATFLTSLEHYLIQLPFESDDDNESGELYRKDVNGFWNNLVELFKKITELIPKIACDELVPILGKISKIITTIETNQNYKIEEHVKDNISKIYRELQEDILKFQAKDNNLSNVEIPGNPPENFRLLSLIPTILDLRDSNPFIRPCKLEGAYDSVEHYLDIQFRLLREDFISPLRDGIKEYLHGPNKYRNTLLRIYKTVSLQRPKESDNSIHIIVSFGTLKNVDWKHSKRFMFGGLVCLSSDNFNSILFATVANRDDKLLQNGMISIEVRDDTVITEDFYHCNWIMLESKIYFEPYLVVLGAMLHMREENFPMKKYLVYAETSNSLPAYLIPVLKTNPVLKYKNFELPISDNNQAWPTPEMLQLDETQFEAFKTALTQEFAVIQGPPGTGKTFIALEIIRTLLENKNNWRWAGPIVIVCLTNHALDQFLEGILKHTESIVRIGNRSKSEALSKYTLPERRKTRLSAQKYHKYHKSIVGQVVKRKTYMAASQLHSINKTHLAVEYLTMKNAVVPLELLLAYCNDPKLKNFNDNAELQHWLFDENYHCDPMEIDIEPSPVNSDALTESGECSESLEDDYAESVRQFKSKQFDPDRCDKPIFFLQNMDIQMAEIHRNMNIYQRKASTCKTSRFQCDILKNKIACLKLRRSDLQHNLAHHPILNREQDNRDMDMISLRWQTYWKWVKNSYDNAIYELRKLETDHRRTTSALNEAKQMVDLETLKEYDIVGLTTTSAARLYTSLRALHAPIVLVEEAAEILESHVVCSLTKNCQHVILIGDHKQLRPKAAVHKLGTEYNLNVSLFERMVNIRGNCTQLAYQHRMRPEIAKLICPSIYKTLYNNQSVLEYPSVMGVKKNVFFINHNIREVSCENQESWMNLHEAKFLVALARHLILQGYNSTEITILCTYTGQLFTLIKEKNNYALLKEVRITTIDNYQGEENRIILLSLVRNNEEGNIGFLKEENRVCVALSRAREGLYIMGNMDNLTTKNDIWPKIKTVLEDSRSIGDSLELHCKFHPDKSINIQKPSDFEQCPEGGCLEKCNTDLPCGHVCVSICHTVDRRHLNLKCKQRCMKTCPDNHACPLLCWQICMECDVPVDRQLKCGHTVSISCGTDPERYRCCVSVDAVLPDCKHAIQKPCYLSHNKFRCTHPCENRLPCGHSCELKCHVNNDPDHLVFICPKPCSKNNSGCSTGDHLCKLQCNEQCIPCPVLVKKNRSCGHDHLIECFRDIEQVTCRKFIQYQKSCGHKLTVRCFQKDNKCEEKVTKTMSCGHRLNAKCYQRPSSSKCPYNCARKLKCGHPCTAKCKNVCITECKALVLQTKPGLCGHIVSVPCYMKETEADHSALLRYCQEPCQTELACGHICKGNCGSCKQGRIHKPCGEKCGNILICGHECEVSCRQECPPCQKLCQVKCPHSRCNKKCGELCIPCTEPCLARCKHSRCLKRCFELCDRTPCTEPCYKVLKCGHKCIGFCGEPCPKLCRVCDKRELMDEFFLGHEDEPSARFVLLEDCGHCIESQGLLKWISDSSDSIQSKTCPRCKTLIRKCMRISNQVKSGLQDIQLVKRKIFGDPTVLRNQQMELIHQVEVMKSNQLAHDFGSVEQFLESLEAKVSLMTKEGKSQVLNVRAVESARIVLDFLQEICENFDRIKIYTIHSYVKDQIVMLVKSFPTRGQISNQEYQDIKRELQRLHYITEISVIKTQADLNYGELTSADEMLYNSIMAQLECYFGKFTKAIEDEIMDDVNALKVSNNLKIVLKNERKMITKAMGFKQGHWYKCPKGHIYAIGECGGAMQKSKCNECGADIGGQRHRLTSGNSLAPEMDGATHPAWSGGL